MPRKVDNLAVTTNGKGTKSVGTGEVKCKSSYHDKQSGSYGRVTTKESVSSGDYTNRGRVGYKDEYKASSTVRVGDKRGYTEFSRQEKFTRVDYGGSNNTNYGGNLVCGGDDDASDSDGSDEDHAESVSLL
ncbi:hypothetical protein BVRB_001420 [Beta vulgaris subsp. vulgaris]|uniref:Uncharacterized protein n=1 Tax=Beta vulgaris subsp. vulgaris TaxID=3555 RepID=A0A0J8B892_BETVV|nr:hypothetical protein BVRB_001420 [Beta vulgaris subsp. vulgaris]